MKSTTISDVAALNYIRGGKDPVKEIEYLKGMYGTIADGFIMFDLTTIPICTGEDIYLKENFRPLLEAGGVSVIHPDNLTSGGILENKKIGDMAQDYEVAMAVHIAESPIAYLAAVHSVAATENFLVLEFHSNDVPWCDDFSHDRPCSFMGFAVIFYKRLDIPGRTPYTIAIAENNPERKPGYFPQPL